MSVKTAAADLQAFFQVDAADVPDRRLYDASKAGMMAVAEAWDEVFKMKHFEEAAAARYHYAPRTAKYMERKLRKKNETRPLVYSRETYNAARQKAFGRAFPTRVTMQLPTPSYIQMVPRARKEGGQHPPMGDEITRTTQEEVAVLENIYRDTVEELIQAYMEGKGNWQGLARRTANARGL
jgi:hypothetical protein